MISHDIRVDLHASTNFRTIQPLTKLLCKWEFSISYWRLHGRAQIDSGENNTSSVCCNMQPYARMGVYESFTRKCRKTEESL